MTVCRAVGIRISKLLSAKNISLYRLEQKSGILHGTMMCIMNERNKNVTLKTVMQDFFALIRLNLTAIKSCR